MEHNRADPPPAYPARQQQWNPPQQYGQQQRQQQYPGQQPYGQQQYAPQPAPATAVVVNQPPPVPQDFTFPNGKCPSIYLIVAAIANLLCWIIVGTVRHYWGGTEWLACFIFYMIAGILGALGSFQHQNHQGMAIGTIVMSIIALILAFVQFVREFVIVGTIDIDVSWPFIIMGFVGLVALIASIVLIVVASLAICDCCRRRQQ